ncbi:3'-5' exonuclease [Streptomyces sp. NRRL_B-2557]|uniref:3'-5' exonuclease n=1 Tax=Streptomyces sp. NRRL_B-2557 TaxID=3028698 RepID=UPI0029B084B6|nr:3'-5' exonuclease [Streptomyces sp. NRRL_B-2557]MDX2748284.1 3'-5' exonuclease [Streptomyces sp. NRRL_B-2557]
MYFDPRSPQQFFEALLQALPNGWGGMCTQSHGEEDEYEELRLKDLACDARAWGKFLHPWEVTPPGEWILIGTEGEDWSPRYGATIGQVEGPGGASALFLYSPGSSVDDSGEFVRLPATTTPEGVAHALCQMSRAADRRVVEFLLRECTKDSRQSTGWFPGKRVVILDLETTGLDRHHDRIVEAAWLLADRRALAWDSVLINPAIPIPHDSYDVHGIDDETVRRQGRDARGAIDEVTGAVAKHIIDGATLVVFNWDFDLPFLDAECRRHGLPTLESRVGKPIKAVDPMLIHQRVSRRGSSKLAHLAAIHSSGNTAAHSALGDCLATWDVLAHLCRNQKNAILRRAFGSRGAQGEELQLSHLLSFS